VMYCKLETGVILLLKLILFLDGTYSLALAACNPCGNCILPGLQG
jgi:hypothetical protein